MLFMLCNRKKLYSVTIAAINEIATIFYDDDHESCIILDKSRDINCTQNEGTKHGIYKNLFCYPVYFWACQYAFCENFVCISCF